MQLTLVFEIVLLVAIVAGVFIGWDVGTKDDHSLQNQGQAPTKDEFSS